MKCGFLAAFFFIIYVLFSFEDNINFIRKGLMKMQELMGQATPPAPETQSTPASMPLQNREVRFFTSPKAVIKKTQLSIILFQLITAGAVCLLLKLCSLFSPELFANLRQYLAHLFLW